MLYELDHFAVEVSDFERSLQFYRDKLGMEFVYEAFDKENHERYAFFKLGENGSFEILQVLDENNQPRPFKKRELKQPFCPHIAFKSHNMAETLAMIKDKGLDVVKGPMTIENDVSWIFIKDPDNNVLEFVHWHQGVNKGPKK